MLKHGLIGFTLGACAVTCTAMLAARGQGGQERYTGTPADIMRVRVINSSRTEALPVSVQEISLAGGQTGAALRVDVANKPTVVLDPGTVVNAKIAPPNWEYKLMAVHPGQASDDARALGSEGAQGWETTGVVLTSPAGSNLLLKRQK